MVADTGHQHIEETDQESWLIGCRQMSIKTDVKRRTLHKLLIMDNQKQLREVERAALSQGSLQKILLHKSHLHSKLENLF